MAKVRVKVMGSGTEQDPWRPDLPTWVMVPGSEVYSDKAKKVLESVEVLVPDDECDEKGQLSLEKIRAKYRGQPHWDRADLLKGLEVREKKRKEST